jgi:hypothetical protein
MYLQKTIRQFILFTALIALWVGITAGNVWHHHLSSSDANCPICHLSHQPVDQPLSASRVPVLTPVGMQLELLDYDFVSIPSPHRIPARAPPAA